METVPHKKVKVFKMKNRKGYGCICLDNLTEGKTPLQACDRMVKALRRGGYQLKEIDVIMAKKLVVSV
ncbi:MAG: hypothetical protein GY858_02510 [Candidatus Omnitrophica bacterium]|nr:hypothetical protein [Candidatus Omnitrophota bacterium]